jgi:predicted RNA binding protein YcfA (HicA-like mRNA interferase family)
MRRKRLRLAIGPEAGLQFQAIKFGCRASEALRLQWKLAKVRDLTRQIESDGWRHVRTTGSHGHFKHATKPNVVTVPGPSR